jgi:hypothetical protein
MEEGFSKPSIFVPLGMGRQVSPPGCPVTDQFKIFRCGCSGEMRNPCIDPPDGIRNIGAIDGETVANEKILCNILFDPFSILNLLLNGPSTICNRPDLLGGFLHSLAERGRREEDEKEQDQKGHALY